MSEAWLSQPAFSPAANQLQLPAALARAAGSMARLDQALLGHPLLPAFLYRARLEAVRLQAAVDGQSIDPWHLAASLEGLRPRMADAPRIADRGAIFEAARHALTLHGWITAPDFDQEAEVQRAAAALAALDATHTPLLAAAQATHAWLDTGNTRPPIRAALIRHWRKHRLLHTSVPMTGPRALGSEVDWNPAQWIPAFLHALAEEAESGLQLLLDLERGWRGARAAAGGQRRHSRAAMAIDIMAAAPIVSATSLAAGLGMAVKNAALLLDRFTAAGIAIEVTHRGKRRLFGLAGLAPLRAEVAPPRRPEPGRGRGRPRLLPASEPVPEALSPEMPPQSPIAPLNRLQHAAIDYSDLEHWMAQAEAAIRSTRQHLAGEPRLSFAIHCGQKR